MHHRPAAPRATIPTDLDPHAELTDPRRLALVPVLSAATRTALDHLAELARSVLDADESRIALLHADHQISLEDDRNTTMILPGYTIALGEPLMLGDLLDEPLAAGSVPVQEGFRAYAGVPLRHAGERVGVLSVLNRRPRAWTISDADRLTTLAQLADHLLTTNAG